MSQSRDLHGYHSTLLSLLNLIALFNVSPASDSPQPLQYISNDQCSVVFPSINTSFNVCNLKLPNGFNSLQYYQVKDYRYDIPEEASHYYYHFNIGAPVLNEDPQCLNITSEAGYCPNITQSGECASDLTPINGTSFAYQLRNDTLTNTIDSCWRLSNENGGPPLWSLVYDANPTDGVILSYLNGDFAHNGACPQNRQFNIAFLCENEFLNVPDEEPLHELAACDYTLEIASIYGCPSECKIYNRQLCNNQGLCGYDFSNIQPRCFCYHAYDGDDCSIFNAQQNISIVSKTLPAYYSGISVHTFPQLEHNGNAINVTYDLTPMALNGSAYNITDKNTMKPYVYFVGLLQPIDSSVFALPEACVNLSKDTLPCVDIAANGSCTSFNATHTNYNNHIYAYQYDAGNEWCGLLGTQYEWQLYDDIDDPARGVVLNYEGGSWCGTRGINRGLRISLVCPDDQEEFRVPNINEEVFVEEDTEAYCEYEIEIQTTIVCPFECRTSKVIDGNIEYSVCSEHGICAVDPNAGFVRCLCDDGWIGVDCDQIDSLKPTQDPTISPSVPPTKRTTRYPTNRARIHNVTIVERRNMKSKTGGFEVIIVVLVAVLIVFCTMGYCVFKRFKQREALLRTQLDEYKQMGSEEVHDIHMNKRGKTDFTPIDHVPTDKNED